MIRPGETAPDFTLPAHTGAVVRLYELLESGPAVLFFYARDATPL
jgi:peroxiredoxin